MGQMTALDVKLLGFIVGMNLVFQIYITITVQRIYYAVAKPRGRDR